jgi:hypothetical protein
VSWNDSIKGYYAKRNVENKTTEYMHSVIIGCKYIDHKNHNGLDNRERNLRCATRTQNFGNQCRPIRANGATKGTWQRPNGTWCAHIGFNGRKIHLGTFKTLIAAQKSYAAKANELFGEFAFS